MATTTAIVVAIVGLGPASADTPEAGVALGATIQATSPAGVDAWLTANDVSTAGAHLSVADVDAVAQPLPALPEGYSAVGAAFDIAVTSHLGTPLTQVPHAFAPVGTRAAVDVAFTVALGAAGKYVAAPLLRTAVSKAPAVLKSTLSSTLKSAADQLPGTTTALRELTSGLKQGLRPWAKNTVRELEVATVETAATGRIVAQDALRAAEAEAAGSVSEIRSGARFIAGSDGVIVDTQAVAADTAGGGAETFFRTMNEENLAELQATGRVPATSETFISPSAEFSSAYEGQMVQFSVRTGTTSSLTSMGVRDGSAAASSAFPNMPLVSRGWTSASAFFKGEGGVVNIGLGRGPALNTFNDSIVGWQVIP